MRGTDIGTEFGLTHHAISETTSLLASFFRHPHEVYRSSVTSLQEEEENEDIKIVSGAYST